MAVFTAGAGNALKWIGKLGKFAPKLARIIRKAFAKVNDALPDKWKKKNKDKNSDGKEDNKDSKAGQKQIALRLAQTITEGHDAKDSPIAVLRANLEVVKKNFKVVKGFEINPKAQKGHYEVWMIASRHKVDDDYTTGHSYPEFEKDAGKSDYQNRKEHRTEVANAKWYNHGNKHKKAKTNAEAKAMSMKSAQYLPGVNNRALETLAAQKGRMVTIPGNKNVKYFFYKSKEIIGYDQGVPTQWVRAEISSGALHGHPMNEKRLAKYLKL